MKHKLVCWDDYAIPAPLWAKWLAWDNDGSAWFYAHKPIASGYEWVETDSGCIRALSEEVPVFKPEPGPWEEQLYWIG